MGLITQLLFGIGNKTKTIKNSTLGEMKYNRFKMPSLTTESCSCNYFFKSANCEVELTFSTGETGPSVSLVDRLKEIERRYEDIIRSIEEYCTKHENPLNINMGKYKISAIHISDGSWSIYFNYLESKKTSLDVSFDGFDIDNVALSIFSEE